MDRRDSPAADVATALQYALTDLVETTILFGYLTGIEEASSLPPIRVRWLKDLHYQPLGPERESDV